MRLRNPFRKHQPALRAYEDPEERPEPTLEELIRDGEEIALVGVRLALKNTFLTRVLRDGEDYDEAWYRAEAARELSTLAAEIRTDEERVAEEIERALNTPGRAAGAADFRIRDVATLRRRRDALVGLAQRLEEMARDGEQEHRIVAAAREQALADITDAAARVPVTHDGDYDDGLSNRKALVKMDLREFRKSLTED